MEKIKIESKTDIKLYDSFEEKDSDIIYSEKDSNQPDHHLLGYYNGIQSEYRELDITQTTIRNLDLDSIKEALNWVLLFQMDSDDNLNLNFVDGGRIYFFIHKHDLKNHDFSKVRVTSDFF